MKRVATVVIPLVLLSLAAVGPAAAKTATKSSTASAASAKSKSPKAQADKTTKVAGPCYSKAEFEAEQAIRFHTRLMVIGLTCQQLGGNYEGLYVRYKQFTLNHKTQIAGWENTLISYYRRTAKGNPYHALDNMRTHLANEMSQHIAAVSANIYCAANLPNFNETLALSESDVQKEALGDGAFRMAELPRCDMPVTAMATPALAPAALAPAPATPAAQATAPGKTAS